MEDGIKVQKNNKYSMAFTTGSLLHPETIKVVDLFVDLQDWKSVSQAAFENNVLQYRTEGALKRTLSEIIYRLKLLDTESLELLFKGTVQDQLQILWFAVCLRYPFIKEFASEVLFDKYRMLQLEVTQLDYDAFFNEKLNWHEELETITDATRYKLKQILFKMLREAEIIDKNNFITTVLITPQVREIIERYDREYLRIFPN